MTAHAEKVSQAERRVVEAAKEAVAAWVSFEKNPAAPLAYGSWALGREQELRASVDALLALEAATCQKCLGEGVWGSALGYPCPDCKGSGAKP